MKADRRHGMELAAGAAALLSCLVGPAGSATRQPAHGAVGAVSNAASFRAFVDGLWPEAERRGVSRALFDAAFAGSTPDPSVAVMARRQPEFAKPIGAYLAAQVTEARVAKGRAMMARYGTDLAAMENRFGVPRSILVAVWGLESAYGTSTGGKDVIRSMATLASLNVRPDLYRGELFAALTLLQNGKVRRQDLKGSWAGAMGLPQFLPSSYATYAIDWDGDGRADIWGSVPDALASIANFIRQQGWQPDRPWGFEVAVPAGFDYRESRASYADWRSLGITRADGGAPPAAGQGILFFPAGAAGPAFLVTENFEVLKTYNSSDAYVLSVADLADRIEGRQGITGSWPTELMMGREDRTALQARLVALGYAVDNREGRISLSLRDVIRTAQASVGLVPDGDPTTGLLRALIERR